MMDLMPLDSKNLAWSSRRTSTEREHSFSVLSLVIRSAVKREPPLSKNRVSREPVYSIMGYLILTYNQ